MTDVSCPGVTLSVLAVLCGATFLCSLLTCHFLRTFAERHALLDHPNERSLHTKPVPRLGGVGIVLGTWCAAAATVGLAPRDLGVLGWLVASALLAGLGLLDDVRGLGAATRLVLQISVVAGFTCVVGVPTHIVIAPGMTVDLPYVAALGLATVFGVGVLNIYNFMDGMDGLAALQAIGAALAVATALATGGGSAVVVPITLAAATLGFFVHNAPPAKIFMGDAGSTFVGFTFAAIALSRASAAESLPFLVVPLALAPFLLDGTYTIFRRLRRGEKIWTAHRSHLYQRAVATGLSHHDVLVRYAAWIACSAVAAVVASQQAGALLVVALVAPLSGLLFVALWVRRLESAAQRGADLVSPLT